MVSNAARPSSYLFSFVAGPGKPGSNAPMERLKAERAPAGAVNGLASGGPAILLPVTNWGLTRLGR